MTTAVSIFLMFEGRAEEALRFYAALFNAPIEGPDYFGEGEGPEGKVKGAALTINGQRFMFFDSPVSHAFGFTPAISIFVECQSAEEVDRLAAALGESGQVMMGLDAYPFARRFTWLADRFGVSWQLRFA